MPFARYLKQCVKCSMQNVNDCCNHIQQESTILKAQCPTWCLQENFVQHQQTKYNSMQIFLFSSQQRLLYEHQHYHDHTVFKRFLNFTGKNTIVTNQIS
ncbi:hypothetical protein NPIL_85621 [Nephila pilipes]|uniref:Uncharacterized protein n=1 Tax=Nephila pilipes TaxID=299642 RepID=A0A8X6I9V3_NEPPI|nr:hypothetical protein NPIL_85621 [Nephila pilipes]